MFSNHPVTYTFKQVENSKGVIIFTHGLTGNQDDEIFIEGEKFFNDNGFSTFRFNLYGDLPGERKLNEVCLEDNIDDINAVIQYINTLSFDRIFLVGHSYGCIANLFVDLSNVSGLLMRDPSLVGNILLQDIYKDNDGYYINWGDGYKYRINEKYYKDFQVSPQIYLEQISKINIPIKIIGAENGLAENAQQYFESAKEPKSITIIKGAYHRFDNGKSSELLSESLKWINTFISLP